MRNFLKSMIEDESGLTTVEYAVGAAVVMAGAGAFFATLGDNVSTVIDNLGKCVADPTACKKV
jgi:pilus assembly protein Flp/PilA